MYNNFITNKFKKTMIDYKELIKSFTEEDYKEHRVNLHIHTTYSDGAGDFASLVRQADGYKAIAISDHNTIEGYLENPVPENVIPAVEFDVWCGYVFMHLLAYGIDVNSDALKPFLAKSKKETELDIIRIFAKRDIKKLIEAIHASGGIAVIAHPACCWALSLDRFFKKLKSYGLDGAEVFYPYERHRGIIKFHTVAAVRKAAEKYGLIMTGGTDLHGEVL